MHLRGADIEYMPAKVLQHPSFKRINLWSWEFNDTQTGMPFGIPKGARCVQRFDDSLNSAIHITYRNSLRSSSMREPRDPLLKVVLFFWPKPKYIPLTSIIKGIWRHRLENQSQSTVSAQVDIKAGVHGLDSQQHPFGFDNDPSAGSPTETLLRLLLPLNDQVWSASQL